MSAILHHKTKLLTLVFLAFFLSAYAGTGSKSKNTARDYRNDNKTEYRSLKGSCNCYKDKNYKKAAKYKKFQKKVHRRR